MDQRAIPPITQLVNPVRAPYQYEKDRQGQEHHEHLEARRQRSSLRLEALRPGVADRELYAKGNEDAEREDLEGEAGDGDVVCGPAVAVGGGR